MQAKAFYAQRAFFLVANATLFICSRTKVDNVTFEIKGTNK